MGCCLSLGNAALLYDACEKGKVDVARLLLERGAVVDSSALCEGDTVEAKYRGRRYYPGKISRDSGEGKYDIAYDDGDRERGVERGSSASYYSHRCTSPARTATSTWCGCC